ncbi:hypothetical protein Z043_123871, partial [Scleropages formosus]
VHEHRTTQVCSSQGKMTTDREITVDDESAAAFVTSHGIDITPNKDQGVIKVVKRLGVDGERPMIGDKVYVHYTGKLLNGKKFDSSLDRKQPFSFNLGKGQVIKAWDVGVASMQRGEVCLFLCKPEYAYGTTGSPRKIAPNSSLLFEVELLSFKGEELTEDGGIVRRIKVKGQGFRYPNVGATVSVHLQGSCDGKIFDSRDVSFVVGEGDDVNVPLGVDRAMEKMQEGECCLLYLKPKYGFGKEGCPNLNIGPNAELMYEVTLHSFQKVSLRRIADYKWPGCRVVMAGRYPQAVIQYQRIVSWLEIECLLDDEQQSPVRDILLVAQLNLALCHLRLREYTCAVHNCNKAIELDERSEKALYRRGEARLLCNEFSLAMDDFQRVLQVNPSNRAARTQISVCQQKIREHHERDKKIYANMFQKFAERDAKAGKLKKRKEETGALDDNSELGTKKQRKSQDHL